MELNIRQATHLDIKSILVLKQQVWISTYANEGLREELSNYVLNEFSIEKVRKTIRDKSRLSMVAEFEGHILGCIEMYLKPEKSIEDFDFRVEISILYVLEKFQRIGVGKKLLAESIRHLKSQNINKVWLTVYKKNKRAIEFYKRNNFKQIGDTDFILDWGKFRNLILVKEI